MDQNKLTLEEAQLLLVENFLSNRRKPKSLAPELLKKIRGETLSTPARDFMTSNGIFKSEKAAFIHSNILGVLLSELEEIAKTQPLTETECNYFVSPELRKDIEIEWGVSLAEDAAGMIEI